RKEGHFWSVIEEPVWLLQLVEVCDHLERGAIEIFLVSGCAVCLELKDREHVHVVDPKASFGGEAVGLRILPLAIGELFAVGEVFGILVEDEDFEGHSAEDLVIDVASLADQVGFSAAGQQRVEAIYQFVLQLLVGCEVREGQGSVPGANLAIEDGMPLVRSGNEMLSDTLPNFLG